jgi:hypothetical protein
MTFFMTENMRVLATLLVKTWGMAVAVDRAVGMSETNPNGPAIVWAVLHHTEEPVVLHVQETWAANA